MEQTMGQRQDACKPEPVVTHLVAAHVDEPEPAGQTEVQKCKS